MTARKRAMSVFHPEITSLSPGYTGLPRKFVENSQRQRLIHAVVTVVADKGFAATTIDDVVEHAGVSKKTFYAHFSDKLACFLAAHQLGHKAMLDSVRSAAAGGDDPVDQLRRGTGAFLRFIVTEERFARMFFLEMPAAGPAAVADFQASHNRFTASLRTWHEAARRRFPDWPVPGDLAFEAATAAINDIGFSRVAAGRIAELPALADALVEIQLSILQVPANTATKLSRRRR